MVSLSPFLNSIKISGIQNENFTSDSSKGLLKVFSFNDEKFVTLNAYKSVLEFKNGDKDTIQIVRDYYGQLENYNSDCLFVHYNGRYQGVFFNDYDVLIHKNRLNSSFDPVIFTLYKDFDPR
jgi:hypothetical protein